MRGTWGSWTSNQSSAHSGISQTGTGPNQHLFDVSLKTFRAPWCLPAPLARAQVSSSAIPTEVGYKCFAGLTSKSNETREMARNSLRLLNVPDYMLNIIAKTKHIDNCKSQVSRMTITKKLCLREGAVISTALLSKITFCCRLPSVLHNVWLLWPAGFFKPGINTLPRSVN